jgi:hypothetical protein
MCKKHKSVSDAAVALKRLAFQPSRVLTASHPAAWEAFLAAVQREIGHMLNHLGHSLLHLS